MKAIKRIHIWSTTLATGIIGLIIGLLYSVIFGVFASSITGLPASGVLEVIYLTIAFGIGSALIWLLYGVLYNYVVVPLTGGIKVDI